MAAIDNAFRSSGFSLADILGIFYTTSDPLSVGFAAPIGSLLLRTNGFRYLKTNSGDMELTQ